MECFRFETIDSTNKKAKELACKKDFVVISKIQTKAKGRFNRKWISNVGGAWFSITVHNINEKPQLLSFCASLAVYDIIAQIGLINPILKWPNDIYIEKKKLCGILVESVIEKNIDVIIGIGINVNNQINDSIKNIATSIKNITKKEINVNKFIENIIDRFEFYLNIFKDNPNIIIQLWKEKCPLIGKEISIKTINQQIKGTFQDIDNNGFMIIDNKTVKEGDLTY